MEAEAWAILRQAVAAQRLETGDGLGRRIASRFREHGLRLAEEVEKPDCVGWRPVQFDDC